MQIRKVAVVGAGLMGSGIAAHVTNAGVQVVLLDIVPPAADNRNVIAEGAVQKLLKSEPAAFMHKRNAKLITTGNTEDDLELLADCDWIIEAVIENLDVKRNLYARLDQVRKPGSVVSSNTSTIPLGQLVAEMPASSRADFLITHFFNPPRYMRLLEVVAGPDTRNDASSAIREFCDVSLGKGVVDCKDTPGFIGNRIGIYWIQCAVLEAIDAGLTVEEADAVLGRPIGAPKTGVFGLADLVGLDLLPHVLQSLHTHLPNDDPFMTKSAVPAVIEDMLANGYTGRKGKGGFYRLNRDGGKRVKEAKDLVTGEYRVSVKAELQSLAASKIGGLRALVEHDDKGGRYAWRVLAETLSYAATLVPTITDDIVAVDTAMRLGFNWDFGPFELIDKLGSAWFAERLEAEGMEVPDLLKTAAGRAFYRVEAGTLEYLAVDGEYTAVKRPPGVLLLADVKRVSKPLAKNGSASVWDIGDGVACLEFHSKMNAIDPPIMEMVRKAIGIVGGEDFKALVIHNEAANFSVGANIGLAMFAINIAAYPAVEGMIREGQSVYQALKSAAFPVVGAPSGMALGGGCEALLHCDAVQAHAETYMGLVEVGVGLIPGWGGCKEMLQRWYANKKRPGGPMPPVTKVFETISVASVARSAAEAKDLLFLRPGDGVSMNRDRLLADAKERALAMVEGYEPLEAPEISLPGPSAKAAMGLAVRNFRLLGKATAYDEVVADQLAGVLSGGDTDMSKPLDTDALLTLERKAFMNLVRQSGTTARIEHMLETGKPLRN